MPESQILQAASPLQQREVKRLRELQKQWKNEVSAVDEAVLVLDRLKQEIATGDSNRYIPMVSLVHQRLAARRLWSLRSVHWVSPPSIFRCGWVSKVMLPCCWRMRRGG
jgi:hypothetical protein